MKNIVVEVFSNFVVFSCRGICLHFCREVGEHGLVLEVRDHERRCASRAQRHDSWRQARRRKRQHSRKRQRTSYLGAIAYGAELCYLGAVSMAPSKSSGGLNVIFLKN
jgi:hypothetical protein